MVSHPNSVRIRQSGQTEKRGVTVFINEFTKRFISKNPRISLEGFDCFCPCIIEEENKELTKAVT